jgi:tetratricopeptide (TPR) repeat protein
MRGECLLRLGETTKAVPELHKSLELNPSLAHAHVLLSKAYDEAGKTDLALAHLEKGAVEDQDGSVHYRLFLLYRKLNQPAKAQEALRRSRELRETAHPPLEVETRAR